MTLGVQFCKAAGQKGFGLSGLAIIMENLVSWGLMLHIDFQKVKTEQVTI